jgi:L-amino acid N-acyltransferase YncA
MGTCALRPAHYLKLARPNLTENFGRQRFNHRGHGEHGGGRKGRIHSSQARHSSLAAHNTHSMLIRLARPTDANRIWEIIEPVIRAGETYALPRDMTKELALAYWMGSDRETFVAEDDGQIVGTYYLRANQQGGGDHVANCGYITAAESMGRGVARTMSEHSLSAARAKGFRAMQFNLVVSTNEGETRLRNRGDAAGGVLPSNTG